MKQNGFCTLKSAILHNFCCLKSAVFEYFAFWGCNSEVRDCLLEVRNIRQYHIAVYSPSILDRDMATLSIGEL